MSWRLSVWPALLGTTLAVALSAGFASPPSKSATSGPASSLIVFKGKALLLPEALKGSGVTADAEPIAHQVVIKEESGDLIPILSDDASRALFQDRRLRDRSVEVRGKRLAKNPYFQVVGFRVEENGAFRIPEYYCEICSIAVRYPQACPCCQAEMVLRMKPETD